MKVFSLIYQAQQKATRVNKVMVALILTKCSKTTSRKKILMTWIKIQEPTIRFLMKVKITQAYKAFVKTMLIKMNNWFFKLHKSSIRYRIHLPPYNHKELIGASKAKLARRALDHLKILIKIRQKFYHKKRIILRIHNRIKMKI